MSVTTLIEFDDATEHEFDASKLELVGDKGKLKFLPIASEILFANFDGNVLPVQPEVSKRGNKTGVFGGTNNTGQINGGVLEFPNQDQSTFTFANITDIVNDFALRFKAISNITTPATPREIARLKSNVDNSEIRWRYQNQGGGVARIYCTVIDSAGVTQSDFVVGTVTLAVGTVTNLAVSNDDDGNLLMFYNGALVNTIVSPSFDFTDCNLRFGNTGGAANLAVADFDNVELFSSHAITAAFTYPYPEATSYPLNEQVMATKIPFPLDEVVSLDSVALTPAGSQLKHIFCLDNKPYWYDPVAEEWTISNVTLAEANTLAEIQANLSTPPLVKGLATIVEIHHIFESESGYATPEIESVAMKYKHEFKADEVNTCLVSGVVKDNANCPVAGATVRVNSSDKFYNNNFIGPSAKAITDEQGKWSMSIPETETDSGTVDFSVEYSEEVFSNGAAFTNTVAYEYKNKVIPNLPTAKFSELADG